MNQLNVIIIEDEESHRLILEAYCKKSGMINLLGSYESIVDWEKSRIEEKIDLLFLDIGIPEISGIDFLRANTIQPQVIFITLNDTHAVEAFEYDVTDYIIKPYTYSRFSAAIDKAARVWKGRQESRSELNSNKGSDLFVNVGSRLIRINPSEITHLEADGNHVNIYLSNGGTKRTKLSLSTLIEELDQQQFIRTHRKYLVRLDCIDELLSNDLVVNKVIIPLSRSYKKQVLASLKLIH